jgi:hypothetical protein
MPDGPVISSSFPKLVNSMRGNHRGHSRDRPRDAGPVIAVTVVQCRTPEGAWTHENTVAFPVWRLCERREARGAWSFWHNGTVRGVRFCDGANATFSRCSSRRVNSSRYPSLS